MSNLDVAGLSVQGRVAGLHCLCHLVHVCLCVLLMCCECVANVLRMCCECVAHALVLMPLVHASTSSVTCPSSRRTCAALAHAT
jgi:hypothetical protein